MLFYYMKNVQYCQVTILMRTLELHNLNFSKALWLKSLHIILAGSFILRSRSRQSFVNNSPWARRRRGVLWKLFPVEAIDFLDYLVTFLSAFDLGPAHLQIRGCSRGGVILPETEKLMVHFCKLPTCGKEPPSSL